MHIQWHHAVSNCIYMALIVLQMQGSYPWFNRLAMETQTRFQRLTCLQVRISKAYLLASEDFKTQPIDGKGWNDGLGF